VLVHPTTADRSTGYAGRMEVIGARARLRGLIPARHRRRSPLPREGPAVRTGGRRGPRAAFRRAPAGAFANGLGAILMAAYVRGWRSN